MKAYELADRLPDCRCKDCNCETCDASTTAPIMEAAQALRVLADAVKAAQRLLRDNETPPSGYSMKQMQERQEARAILAKALELI